MANKKTGDDQYSPEEAKERMKAALLGARIVGHVPMKTKKEREASKPTPRPRSRQKINKDR